MSTQYYCKNTGRRDAVKLHPTLNGIDYLEVLDRKAPLGTPRQVHLMVRCLKLVSAPGQIYVKIEGGVRITPVTVQWVYLASEFSTNPAEAANEPNCLVSEEAREIFSTLEEPDHVLVVRTDSAGDFSTYTLSLLEDEDSTNPPENFDTRLSQVEFSFKVECPSDFDCRGDTKCISPGYWEPEINYLARDYSSFRTLMLDRLRVLMPYWKERSAADLQIALVELLAYVGDRLSYYQDAAATEAYLDTARRRISVGRHARLVDYFMHDGCSARTWVFLEVEAGSSMDGAELSKGTPLLTPCSGESAAINPANVDVEEVLAANDPRVFETMFKTTLYSNRNRIEFYTWSDKECCLPKGATRATLYENPGMVLTGGDLLLFEEVLSPFTGLEGDIDPCHRHVVRLTKAEHTIDPLDGTAVVNIQWHEDDALPFPLCISAVIEENGSESLVSNAGIARGNMVSADHGHTIEEEFTGEQIESQDTDPLSLANGPVTCFDEWDANGSAASVMERDLGQCCPVVELIEDPGGKEIKWNAQKDLLASDKFTREFVVESESDGTAYLRFGDDIHGKKPGTDIRLKAFYRVGNGVDGNVGADAIRHIVTDVDGIAEVRNPLPAAGGADPETMAEVRRFAPQAFRTQERAVTEEDYAEKAMLYPGVRKAVASFKWTGSWHTVFLVIDREKGESVEDDEPFKRNLYQHMEQYRMAGFDLEIDDPVFVSLDIVLSVCVKPGYFKSDIKEELIKVFSNYEWSPGQYGFFHPDNFTFGQSVYLSGIYETAMKVDGVAYVEVTRFQRWGEDPGSELEDGVLKTGRVEIVRLDNDPNFPENGKIEFEMKGGI